jgi:hypothetical protein
LFSSDFVGLCFVASNLLLPPLLPRIPYPPRDLQGFWCEILQGSRGEREAKVRGERVRREGGQSERRESETRGRRKENDKNNTKIIFN